MNTPMRVLVVDDEARFRTTLSKMLRARGVAAQAVGSGEECLEELAARPYDVVLLDIRMPGLGGMETLRLIKERHPEVEVVMLSGHANLDTAIELLKLGAYDYLLKPCPLDEVLLKIENAFEKKQELARIKALAARRGDTGQ
ncbi:MAG: response regulator [Syntrophobacterales bacterium]|jgi:DNA-binding NtrC family response regulator|nr:response regulator [Syntrophobacterales bacterium]